MDNMQDILKSYYASGGKNLFENQTLLEYNQATTISLWGDKILLAAVANQSTSQGDQWLEQTDYDYEADDGTRLGPWVQVLTTGAPESEQPNYGKYRQNFLRSFLMELEEADPTDNNQYMMWLVKTYCQSIKADAKHQADFERENPDGAMAAGHWSEWDMNDDFDADSEYPRDDNGTDWGIEEPSELNSFRLEDVDQIEEVLANYHRIKPQLPQPERDINRFKTFNRLEDYVDNIMAGDQIPNPETDDKLLNRSDVELIYNGPLGTVTIPRSHKASCALGSGTKWCTTGRDDMFYNSYSERGDLIIYNEKPGNNKYQIHATLNNIEARDARDRTVTSDKFKEFTTSHPVLSKLIKQKQLKLFTDKAQADPDWPSLRPRRGMIEDAITLLHDLIDLNKHYKVGVMTYAETYYTQLFLFDRKEQAYSGQKGTEPTDIGKNELDRLVTYAEQRGKPWPELQQQVVEYVKRRYANRVDDAGIQKFAKQNKAPSFPADAEAAKEIEKIKKGAQDIYKTEEARQLLIVIKQFKRLRNPWPELDAIQAQLEGKGVSNTPDDMNIETVNLSDIRV